MATVFMSTSTSSDSGKTKTKGKRSGFKPSSGLLHTRKRQRLVRFLNKKIARWERNQADPQKIKAGKHRHGWNTAGLKAHLALIERK